VLSATTLEYHQQSQLIEDTVKLSCPRN